MNVIEARTGAAQCALALRERGVTTIFSVSGNQILSLYEGIAEAGLRIVHTRHESAAAYAAAGWAETSGAPGVALVAGGPAFLASLTGVAVAASMELPVLLLSGGPPVDADRPGAFQYVDQATIAATLCKETLRCTSAAEAAADVAFALDAAALPIPGPVHLVVPVDVAAATAQAYEDAPRPRAPQAPVPAAPLEKIAEGLGKAKRPLLIVRPSAARGAAGRALREISARLGVVPVVMECPRGSEDLKYRAQARRYRDADYVLLVGPADFAVHFLRRERIASEGRVALVDVAGDPLAQRSADVHVRATPDDALPLLAKMLPAGRRSPWVEESDLIQTVEPTAGLHPYTVGLRLREALLPEDLVVLDGGEFCQWVRLALASAPNAIVWNSRFGAIGGSIPLALGAAAARPDRRVVVVIGDGSFGYHGSEFETAVRERLKITVIVGNDERWAAEWHGQLERYGRAYATMLTPARYDEVARGYGASGREVVDEDGFSAALAQGLREGTAVCLNVRIASVRSPAAAP